jgi:hypothetical protein
MFLVNGIRLQGHIKRFDNFTVQRLSEETARGSSTNMLFQPSYPWTPSNYSIPMPRNDPA